MNTQIIKLNSPESSLKKISTLNSKISIKELDESYIEMCKKCVYEVINLISYEKNTAMYTLDMLLKDKKLAPDLILETVILNSKNSQDLFMIYLAIKNDANANLYISLPGYGKYHILIVCFIIFFEIKKDINLFLLSILILLKSGSCLDRNSYIKPNENERSYVQTVTEWFEFRRFILNESLYDNKNIVIFLKKVEPILNSNTDLILKILSIYFNEPELHDWYISDLQLICMSRIDVWNNIKGDKSTSIFINKPLEEAFLSCFPDIIEQMVDEGMMASYFDFNHLIVYYKYIFNTNKYLIEQIEKCIILFIEKGYKIDEYQYQEIASFSSEFSSILTEIYQVPYWIKVCKPLNSKFLPKDILVTKELLGITSDDKKSICKQLEDLLNNHDISFLQEGIVTRQQAKMSATVGSIEDFISNVPKYQCQISSLNDVKNPLEYSDLTIAYYKDDENKVWCYLSSSFDILLSSKKNPETNKPLPGRFLVELESKKKYLEQLDIKEPQSLVKIIEDLKRKDTISNKETNFYIEYINTMLKDNGVNINNVMSKTPIRTIVSSLNNGDERIALYILSDPSKHSVDENLSLEKANIYSLPLAKSTLCRMLYLFSRQKSLTMDNFIRSVYFTSK